MVPAPYSVFLRRLLMVRMNFGQDLVARRPHGRSHHIVEHSNRYHTEYSVVVFRIPSYSVFRTEYCRTSLEVTATIHWYCVVECETAASSSRATAARIMLSGCMEHVPELCYLVAKATLKLPPPPPL